MGVLRAALITFPVPSACDSLADSVMQPALLDGVRKRVHPVRPGTPESVRPGTPEPVRPGALGSLGNTYGITGRYIGGLPALARDKVTDKKDGVSGAEPSIGSQFKPPSDGVAYERITRWLMVGSVRELWRSHRCGSCHRVILTPDSGLSGVPVKRGESRARFANVGVCGSVWGCAVCAPRVGAKRAAEIAKILTGQFDNNHRAIHIVQTFAHTREDDLKHLLSMLASARLKMHASREYKAFRKEWGVNGYIRTLEITHGNANGWHPHIHQILLTDDSWYLSRFVRMRVAYLKMWRKYASKAGLISVDDACTFDIVSSDAKSIEKLSSYVTDDGLMSDSVEPYITDDDFIEVDNQINGAKRKAKANKNVANEMTLQALKRGKAESRTPMQLLREYSLNGDAYAGALFHEYLDAFDKKRQVTFSDGLRAKFGVKTKTDEELAETAFDDEVTLGVINRFEWAAVLADRRARGEILRLAEAGEWVDVAKYVEKIYVKYVLNKVECAAD